MKLSTLAFAVLALTSFGASAAIPIITIGGTPLVNAGQITSVAGATTVDFDGLWPSSTVDYSYTNFNVFAVSDPTAAAAPPLDTTAFMSVGGAPKHAFSSTTVNFTGNGISYFGFYMGSPDAYNTVTLQGTAGTYEISGASLHDYSAQGTSLGNQADGFYVNIAVVGGTYSSVTFASNQNAFETDNHAYLMAAVPEAQTYAMMLAGLGVVGLIGRRRKA